MKTPREEEPEIQKDIQHLTRTLTPDNLDAKVMFAKERGIRSCTPPFDGQKSGPGVRERLKRVRPPKED
ncbi:MAG TPA: hypothetical protein VHN82_03490 [Methanoregula sp.]|nr:hypothetical protein [Methanoregula sp.]